MTARNLAELNRDELAAVVEELRKQHAEWAEKGLSLNLTRGKPAPEQLDLSEELLTLPGKGDHRAADGTDTRNYGGLQGLLELREIIAPALDVPVEQLVAEGNASLALMYQCVADALLFGVPGGDGPWRDVDGVAFLCPVPGYDRHFNVCKHLGVDMITVPMTETGPDMDAVRELVAENPRIKGIWCVPTYSNPTGIVYSDETVRALAEMPTAANDFRIFWDNAYAVHHLTETEHKVADILAACAEAGNPDRAYVFGSTSKITAAGAGVAFFGSSKANVDAYLEHMKFRTIGPDKVNQLRHAKFLRDAEGLRSLMARHREILAPKFAAVDEILERDLRGQATASWSKPAGGYFVDLDVADGCATRVVELAGEAGVALTPAGATFPLGDDPRDRNIRIAPSFPGLDELRTAVEGLALCVRLAEAEKLLG